jgi:2-keto-4-pentenoate hydratase
MISSGSELNWDELTRPGFENEICFRMARDLKGPGVTAEMARAAVSTLSPAIELVENRGDFTAQLAVSLADNVQQCGFILGSPIVCEDSLDIGSVDARVFVNDDLAGQGNAIAVLGNPFNSLAWLANKLSEFGQSVKVDQWIMAGSLTRQFALGRGDRIATLFSALGAVEFRII